MKTYSELIKIDTFFERYEYLKLDGAVGLETFGVDRYLNQALYTSYEWKRVRNIVITRDNGCDLGIDGMTIPSRIIIHHMNPITIEQVINRDPIIFDPEYLITTQHSTHNAIHYANDQMLSKEPIVRTKGDTCPWKIASY